MFVRGSSHTMSHNLKTNHQSEIDFYYQQIEFIEKNKQELTMQWQELPQEKSNRFFDIYLLHLENYMASYLANIKPQMDIVLIGSRISIMYLEDDEEESYTICFPDKVDPDNGKISIFSPIGRQLLMKKLGEEIQLDIPTGTLNIKIVSIHHFSA